MTYHGRVIGAGQENQVHGAKPSSPPAESSRPTPGVADAMVLRLAHARKWLAAEVPGVVVIALTFTVYFAMYEAVKGESGNSDGFYAGLGDSNRGSNGLSNGRSLG